MAPHACMNGQTSLETFQKPEQALDTSWHEAGHAVLIAHYGQRPGAMASTQQASEAAGIRNARGFVDTRTVRLDYWQWAVMALGGAHGRDVRHRQVNTLFENELAAAITAIRQDKGPVETDISSCLLALIEWVGRPSDRDQVNADAAEIIRLHGPNVDAGVADAEFTRIRCERGFNRPDGDLAIAFRAAEAESRSILNQPNNRAALRALAETLAAKGSLTAAEVNAVLGVYLPAATTPEEPHHD